MSVVPSAQQLQQDLQNELTTANQLLQLIAFEVQKIKAITCADGEFLRNIKQNTSIITNLAKIQQINIDNLPPLKRAIIDIGNNTNENMSV